MKKILIVLGLLVFAGNALAKQTVLTNTRPDVDTSERPMIRVIPISPSGTPLPTPGVGGSNVTITLVGTPVANNNPFPVSATVTGPIPAGTNTIGAVGVTSTTMPSWTVVSTASYSVTGTVRVDLATVAGSGKIYMYKLSALGPGAGVYYGTAPSTTWVPPASYYAVSTTPVVEDYLTTGTFLQLSATASAVTVTAQVVIYSLTQVVP